MKFKLVLLTILIILMFSSCSKHDSVNNELMQNSESTLVLLAKDNKLYLYDNKTVVKQYYVNISVLPGEDINLLYEGIEVKDISEADAIAENFDG